MKFEFLPGWLNKFYANTFGFFWMNCEHCGKGFGGHQWTDYDGQDIPTDRHGGRCAYCLDCAKTREEWDTGWKRGQALWFR